MNGITYTIQQALASPQTGLQVADSAANIAAALPNTALTGRVANFALTRNGVLSTSLVTKLAGLGAKFHLGGYQLAMRDTLAAIDSPSNAAGVALASSRTAVDAAYNLLSAAAGAFAHVSAVILTGTPTLSVAQLGTLEALPAFSVDPGAHVTLADSLAAVDAALTAHSAWFGPLSAVSVRLDGSSIGAYPAAQLAGLAGHGKTASFVGSAEHTTLPVLASAHDLAANAAGLNQLAGSVTLTYTLTGEGAAVTAADATALTGLHGFLVGNHTLFVTDNGANITAHAASIFAHGFTEIVVTSGSIGGTAAQLLDSSLHLNTGATATLTASALLNAPQAGVLAALPGLARANGVTLTVQDSAGNLLALSHAAQLAASAELLTPGAVTLSAAQAAGLVALSHFSASGAVITVADSVAALSNDATILWHNIASTTHVADSAATLAADAGFDLLQNADSVTLTGNAVVGAGQAAALATIPHFAATTGQLIVLDGASAIAAAAPAIASLGALAEVNDNGPVSAMQADALATLIGEHHLVFLAGTALTVADSFAALTAPGNAAGTALAARFIVQDSAANLVLGAAHNWGALAPNYVLAGDDIVTAAQATTLSGLGNAFDLGGHTLSVSDDAADVVGASASLATLGIGAAAVDTAAGLAASESGLQALGSALTGISVQQSDPTSAAVAATLAPLAGKLGNSAMQVGDNAADVWANLTGLETLSAAIGQRLQIVMADSVAAIGAHAAAFAATNANMIVYLTDSSPVTAATAAALVPALSVLAADAVVAVTDTGAALAADATTLHTLGGVLGIVNLADGNTQSAGVASGLALIATHLADPVSLTITGNAAQLAAAQDSISALGNAGHLNAVIDASDSVELVTTNISALNDLAAHVTINDSAATVAGTLDQLAQLQHLDSITLSDGGRPDLTVSLAQLGTDATVLAAIDSPYGFDITGSASAFTADLISQNSLLLANRAHLDSFSTGGDPITLTQAQFLVAGVGTDPGDALTHFSDQLDVTGVDLNHLAVVAGAARQPDSIAISDSAEHIEADLAGDSPALLQFAGLVGGIAVTDGGAITLTAAQALAAGVDDGSHALFAGLAGGTLAITDCSIGQLAGINQLWLAPTSISINDTAAHIAQDLASGNSALIQDLGSLGAIHISDAMPLSLTETQALAPYVDDGPGSALSHVSGGGFSTTGVAADDVTQILGLGVAPTQITISDTAQKVAADLSSLIGALGKVTGITVTGGVLTLTAAQAETAGVADGAHSLVEDISGHLFNVANASVADLDNLAGLTDAPSHITVADSSDAIAQDLGAQNSAIVASLPSITELFVTGGTLTLGGTMALALAQPCYLTAIATRLDPAAHLVITGVTLAGLPTLANIPANHLTLQVADSTAAVLTDLTSDTSLLQQDSALLASVMLNQGDTISGAQIAVLAAYGGLQLQNGVVITVTDNAANIAALGESARALAGDVQVTDTALHVGAHLDTLQTLYGGHNIQITLSEDAPALVVNAATYALDGGTIDAVTNHAAVTITGNAAAVAALAATAADDTAVGQVIVTDAAADVVGNLVELQLLGSKLSVTLNQEAPLAASLVVPLLGIANLNLGGLTVADTASQIAAVVESGNQAAIAFLNSSGAALSGDSTIGVADVAALAQLTDFSKAGHHIAIWDTATHLTAPGAAAALGNALVDSIHLKTTNGAVTLTAATAASLFAISGFSSTNPDSTPNIVTVSDTAAHIDAARAGLGTIGAGIAHITVSASATVTDAVLADLQTLGATAANGVSLTVRDTAAAILAGAPRQALGQSLTPAGWALSGGATVSEANAVILANLPHFSTGAYGLTLSINADTNVSLTDANSLVTLGGALGLNGHHLLVAGTVAQLSQLTIAAQALVTPEITDSLAHINALNLSSPLLDGTVMVNDTEQLSAAQATHFLGLVNAGSGPGINPAHLNFCGHTQTVSDSVAALQGVTTGPGWAALQSRFQLNAADTVANLINGINTAYLAGLHGTTLAASATIDAADAESLATLASQIHFSLGDNALTIADSAANLLDSANSDGVALATIVTLAGNDSTDTAGAETLLGNAHFMLNSTLTITDNSANLLDGVLGTLIANSPYDANIAVQLAGPETLDAPTAEALVALHGFNDIQNMTIADSSAYLLDSANLTAEQMAVSVTLAGDETVSANTVLRLSELPHFSADDGMLTLAGNDFANAATLKAVADLGTQFSAGGHSITLTQDALDLTPTEFAALQADGVVANGHLVSAVPVNAHVTDDTNMVSLSATGVAGAAVHVYGEDGSLLTSIIAPQAQFTVSAADPGSNHNFSFTELVNGTESAPLVVLDANVLANAVSAASASFAASGAIEVDPGKYLNLYTAGSVPVLNAPALVYDPSAHTVALDIPGNAPVTLITLGAGTHPASLDISEVLVKHYV
jgi:hypothetical protein